MIERRFIKSGRELRADSQGDEGGMVIFGYAARFGQISEPLEGFREMLKRGCFSRSLQSDRDVRCNFQHDQSSVLGRRKNGTLAVAEDDSGVRFRCSLPNTQAARDVYQLIQRRDISDCSFEFSVDGEDGEQWSQCDDPDNSDKRVALRTITRANLYALSVVGQPAYPNTSVSASALPEMNALPIPRGMPDFFPEGLPSSFPMEMRSRILQSHEERSRIRQSRTNLRHLMLS